MSVLITIMDKQTIIFFCACIGDKICICIQLYKIAIYKKTGVNWSRAQKTLVAA
jgi:hypothetical protein